MEGDFIKINEWLLPLSWLYGLGVKIRNWCFDTDILKQHSFTIPVISVGNITVGGCGKTPHVEYLIQLLNPNSKVAVLSRGYKRKSKGYILASSDTKMPQIGDEPYQMKNKFPDVHIAVDADRVHGIKRILKDESTNDTDVILLDDAYQHRYVKPGLNILLVDYHRLIIYDRMLPAGRLREHHDTKERADIVIVTKCPEYLKPMDYRVITKALELRPYQQLYFTGISYDELQAFKNGSCRRRLISISPDENILLISGIASPEQLIADISTVCKNVTTLIYSDHHTFSRNDIETINRTFAEIKGSKIIITTEKDAVRLRSVEGLSKEVIECLFVLPIHIKFLLNQQDDFNERIFNYVTKNSKNRALARNSKK